MRKVRFREAKDMAQAHRAMECREARKETDHAVRGLLPMGDQVKYGGALPQQAGELSLAKP